MKRHNILLISLMLISGTIFSSCSCSNDNNIQFSDGTDLKTIDKRIVFTLSEDKSYYKVKMNEEKKNTSDMVIIPSSYMDKPVLEIEDNALDSYKYIQEVVFPNSITKFGKNVLKDCNNITKITLPFNSEDNNFIGYLFGEDKYTSYSKITPKLTTITINNGKSIPEGAFYQISSLTNIYLPSDLERIEDKAFYGCNNLNNISIPNSINYVGEEAFYKCESLDTRTYKNCLYLGNTSNRYLVMIDITSGAEKIESHEDCKAISLKTRLDSITGIEITNKVESISIKSTNGLSSLNNISVYEGNPNYRSNNNCRALIDSRTSTLVLGCKSSLLTDTLGILHIGKEAFKETIVNEEKTITIPSTVLDIGESAFESCTKLTYLQINKKVTTLPKNLCLNCENLNSLFLPKNVRTIYEGAFVNTKLNIVYFGCSEEEFNNDYITTDRETKIKLSMANQKTFNYSF